MAVNCCPRSNLDQSRSPKIPRLASSTYNIVSTFLFLLLLLKPCRSAIFVLIPNIFLGLGIRYFKSLHLPLVWEEMLQNKRLDKYNQIFYRWQFCFYQSDGLTKFDSSDNKIPLPSCECISFQFVTFTIMTFLFFVSWIDSDFCLWCCCAWGFIYCLGPHTNVEFAFVPLVQRGRD